MDGITMIDFLEGGLAGRTCGYLIRAEKCALIETGPSPAGEIILNTLEEQGLAPEDIDYVIVTHIHLDHAGAAGYLLSKCPRARLLLHPAGVKHMIDPSRLIAGAAAAYGTMDDSLRGVLPVLAERVTGLSHEEQLDLGGRTLTFYHGKGHASHHLTILDSLTNGLFCGDQLGIYYPDFAPYQIEYAMLSTPPSQFDPQSFRASVQELRLVAPDHVYFSHFGIKEHLAAHYLDLTLKNIDLYVQVLESALAQGAKDGQDIEAALYRAMRKEVESLGWPAHKPFSPLMESHIRLNARGLWDWAEKMKRDGIPLPGLGA